MYQPQVLVVEKALCLKTERVEVRAEEPAVGPIAGPRDPDPTTLIALHVSGHVNEALALVIEELLRLGMEVTVVRADPPAVGPTTRACDPEPLALAILDPGGDVDEPQAAVVE